MVLQFTSFSTTYSLTFRCTIKTNNATYLKKWPIFVILHSIILWFLLHKILTFFLFQPDNRHLRVCYLAVYFSYCWNYYCLNITFLDTILCPFCTSPFLAIAIFVLYQVLSYMNYSKLQSFHLQWKLRSCLRLNA